MDDKSKQIWDECEALLTACKLIGVHTIGMQSRLELGMPVEVDMRLLEADLDDIKGCVERLRRDVDEATYLVVGSVILREDYDMLIKYLTDAGERLSEIKKEIYESEESVVQA